MRYLTIPLIALALSGCQSEEPQSLSAAKFIADAPVSYLEFPFWINVQVNTSTVWEYLFPLGGSMKVPVSGLGFGGGPVGDGALARFRIGSVDCSYEGQGGIYAFTGCTDGSQPGDWVTVLPSEGGAWIEAPTEGAMLFAEGICLRSKPIGDYTEMHCYQ
jgi:hypothetical protein